MVVVRAQAVAVLVHAGRVVVQVAAAVVEQRGREARRVFGEVAAP
tara:strand:- start:375 stop:509 length:135 start_codon:yes stop_codon:yes gene_type:complete